jgi:hypothetical protein
VHLFLCLFPDFPFRGVGVDSPVFNTAVMEYGGGTCVKLGCIFSNSVTPQRYDLYPPVSHHRNLENR